jgi:hypothetical protein
VNPDEPTLRTQQTPPSADEQTRIRDSDAGTSQAGCAPAVGGYESGREIARGGISRYKYRALLIALLLVIVAYPVLRGPAGSPLLAKTLLTVMFLIGGWVIFAHRRFRVLAAALVVPAVIGVWTGYALAEQAGSALVVFFHLATVLFMVFVLTFLLRGVHRAETISVDAIAAALCGYLVLGMTFGNLYCLVEALAPGSFAGLARDGGAAGTHFRLVYFSLVTLTTVGYGDITPASDPARALCVVEAVIGQFYLAVLVAELVGKRVAQALSVPTQPSR